MENYSECASDFRRVTVVKPDLVPAWTLEGLCEYQLRDYKAALKSLTQVQRLGFQEDLELSLPPDSIWPSSSPNWVNSEKAIAWLYKLIIMMGYKKTPEIIVALGIAGLRKPWIPPEVPESDHAKVLRLGDAIATFMLGDTKDAFDEFEAALRDYPKEPDFHYRFGAFLVGRDPDRGIQEIKKALDLEPGHVPALVALARIYVKLEEPQTALPYAERAVKLSPGDITAHVTLGQALLAAGDAAGAAGTGIEYKTRSG